MCVVVYVMYVDRRCPSKTHQTRGMKSNGLNCVAYVLSPAELAPGLVLSLAWTSSVYPKRNRKKEKHFVNKII